MLRLPLTESRSSSQMGSTVSFFDVAIVDDQRSVKHTFINGMIRLHAVIISHFVGRIILRRHWLSALLFIIHIHS
jgi:hypothetical protein